jgi:hypothetical protein
MANSKIDFSTITAAIPEAVQELSDMIKLAVFEHPDLKQLITVADGIKYGKKVGYYDKLGSIGMKKGATACTLNTIAASVTTSEKTWTPGAWDTRLVWCADDIKNTIAAKTLKTGVNRFDMTNTEYMDLVAVLVQEALVEFYWRTAWFGDLTAANTDDSPAGYITPTVDVKFLNFCDGLFKRAYAIIAAAPAQRISLATYNNQATYALQRSSLSAANALIAAQQMILLAPMELRSALLSGEYVQACTQMFYDKVAANFQSFALESMKVNLENGVSGIKIEGVTFIAVPSWDNLINIYENDGTKWHDPYRSLLYNPKHALIGVPSISDWGTFESWYEKKDKSVYIDMDDTIDTQWVYDNMVMFAV